MGANRRCKECGSLRENCTTHAESQAISDNSQDLDSKSDLSESLVRSSLIDQEDGAGIIGFEHELRISDVLRAKHANFKSIGSSAHSSGNCVPCLFESKHLNGLDPACFKGSLCDRCREDHAVPVFAKPTGRARQRRRLARSDYFEKRSQRHNSRLQ